MSAPAIISRTVEIAGEQNAYKFGEIFDEPIEEYHAKGAISKSKLDVFRQSPALFKKQYITKELPRQTTAALIMGSAVDALALEGLPAYNAKFITEPDDAPKKASKREINAKRGQSEATVASLAWWANFEAEAKGKTVLSEKEAALAKRCADALHANPTFARFMQFGRSQVTFRIRGDKFALQCRPDRWLEDGCDLTDGMPCIVDVKTIQELPADDPDHLGRHIAQFGYHRGAYLYREIVATVKKYRDGYRPPFVLVFVEKQEPHAVVCRVVDDVSIDLGEREVGESIARMRKCLAEDVWPESWEAPLSKVSLPNYYIRRSLENTESNLFG